MPTQSGRGILNPDVVAQMKTLFGTARNAHARLGLGQTVILAYVAQAFSGYEIPRVAEARILERWQEWRNMFLASPKDESEPNVEEARRSGDYYDEEKMRGEDGRLIAAFPRFTLL